MSEIDTATAEEAALCARVRECLAHDLASRVPLVVDGRVWGHADPQLVQRLADLPEWFARADDELHFAPVHATPEARSAIVARVIEVLPTDDFFGTLRGELYPVVDRWGDAPVFAVERGAVGAFGTPAFGVHMNGFVRRADGLHLWVARRSDAKPTFPGRLDHLVGGGQPMGMTLMANMRKECREEASIPDALLEGLTHVHALRYRLQDEYGWHEDTMHVFDLELPESFRPASGDGEVAAFELWPVGRVIATLRAGRAFKTNVALVIIDWLLRAGVLDGDPERAALERLVQPLRQSR